MWTRTSSNWSSLPGYFDRHNTFEIFESTNEYGIPNLINTNPPIPDNLVPYNIRVRSELGYKGLGIHFFLDDYRFEGVWVKPESCLERIKAAEIALTPDFSLYLDFPRAIQIYNTYRNRWLGRFWQERGVQVIPTISWADKESFKFCFLGIPQNMSVAISTVSVDKHTINGFMKGFVATIETINPSTLLCYGKILPEMLNYIDESKIRQYQTSFSGLRNLRKNKSQSALYAA